MAYLRYYILIVDILFGVGAFAALFNSSFGATEKTFFALGFLQLAFMIEVYFMQSNALAENYSEGIFAAIQAIEKRLEGKEVSVNDAVEAKVKELEFRDLAGGQGYPHVVLISVRFGGWVGGGWLVARFLLPHL
jgi:hypothetical protein